MKLAVHTAKLDVHKTRAVYPEIHSVRCPRYTIGLRNNENKKTIAIKTTISDNGKSGSRNANLKIQNSDYVRESNESIQLHDI